MDFLDELEKIDREITEAEMRFKTLEISIEGIEKEASILTKLESHLIENIDHLRQSETIAIVNEFKKAKDDLTKTQNRLALLRIDLENQRRAKVYAEDVLKAAKKAYEKVLKTPVNKVIQGNFGRKDGQDGDN